jgi:hypothetical protein
MTRTFTVSGVCHDLLPFRGTLLRATWTDGVVEATGVALDDLQAEAAGMSAAGVQVGIPTGPWYDPADWRDPVAFLEFARSLCGTSLVVEGGAWLPEPPAAPEGAVN